MKRLDTICRITAIVLGSLWVGLFVSIALAPDSDGTQKSLSGAAIWDLSYMSALGIFCQVGLFLAPSQPTSQLSRAAIGVLMLPSIGMLVYTLSDLLIGWLSIRFIWTQLPFFALITMCLLIYICGFGINLGWIKTNQDESSGR